MFKGNKKGGCDSGCLWISGIGFYSQVAVDLSTDGKSGSGEMVTNGFFLKESGGLNGWKTGIKRFGKRYFTLL